MNKNYLMDCCEIIVYTQDNKVLCKNKNIISQLPDNKVNRELLLERAREIIFMQ